MYGMINQAVRKLVVDNHGEATWKKICDQAGLIETDFSSMQKYPDEVTYKLVGAASKVLGAPPEQVLEAFGEYWTDYAKQTSFARLLQFGGRSMEEFVNNLDQMHAKIKFSLPDLEPPMFRATDITKEGFRLHYFSKRPGLAPVVIGMMKGIAKIYGVGIDMRLDRGRSQGHDHDEFTVKYLRAAQAAE
jgi:hypothetical protein